MNDWKVVSRRNNDKNLVVF